MTPETDALRIAQLAPLWTRVPPIGYGGAELMVHWLTEELIRQGHDVTLFASADSSTSAELRPVCERSLMEAMRRGEAHAYEPYAISAFVTALLDAETFDVIHSHLGPPLIPLGSLAPCPAVHTVHAGLVWADELWILDRHPDAAIAAISESQVGDVPRERRSRMTVVYHGCDFDRYRLNTAPGEYLAFIGRMGPHKNPVDAIRIARTVGMPIVLAGRPQNEDEEEYFTTEVEPLLEEPGVEYAGEISPEAKVDLLGGAAALLFPIQWDEHFGLVMVEAMACGTPVLAYPRGSVPEIVDPGVTGFWADSRTGLETLVPTAMELDRRSVRDHARERFGVERMARDYVRLYRSLASP